jgi:glycosyltransferase involved in cell wall biosynthesis
VRRILIDVTRLMYRRVRGTLPTGIDRVGIAYVGNYREGARAVLSLGPFTALLSEQDSSALFDAALADGRPSYLWAAWILAKAFLWRWLAGAKPGDILFNTSHTGLENRHYAALLRASGAKLIVVVHDLIPITHPQYSPPVDSAKHRARMRCAARNAAAIVVNSCDTLEALSSFARSESLVLPCTEVARLGSELRATASGERPLEQRYFVMLATLDTRKNHELLLDIWSRLATDAPTLVLIGQPGTRREYVDAILSRCAAMRDRVRHLPRCSDAELATWIQHAEALLMPSFAEGFGLPIVEAMSRGVPVIASDISVFREIAGDIPEFANPDDADRWRSLVSRFALRPSPERDAQLERMRSYHAPTWPAHFEAVDRLLSQVSPS